MCERLKALKGISNEEFVKIDNTNFKSDESDALVVTQEEINELLVTRINEEIPFISNLLLRVFLPERFNNDLILTEIKELAKYDHTLLSNLINDKELFYTTILSYNSSISDWILDGSEITKNGNYFVFIREK